VFIFEFGSVVTWGMTLEQEKRFLSTLYVLSLFLFLLIERTCWISVDMEADSGMRRLLVSFVENVSRSSVSPRTTSSKKNSTTITPTTLESTTTSSPSRKVPLTCSSSYLPSSRSREIWRANPVFDFSLHFALRTKLSLSHAIAQSVKLSFFESAVSNTIDETKDIPTGISQTGKIGLPRVEISAFSSHSPVPFLSFHSNGCIKVADSYSDPLFTRTVKQIGRLFLLRVNISLGMLSPWFISTIFLRSLQADQRLLCRCQSDP
jgi:hypothetical protein